MSTDPQHSSTGEIAWRAASILAVSLGVAACSEDATEPIAGSEPEPSWRETVVTEVVSGGDFRIDDLAGDRVFVAVISTASAESRLQVEQLGAAMSPPISGEVVVVSFADEAKRLEEYYAETAYPYYFAVGTEELESRILDVFDPLVLDVSAYPVVQVCPDGGERLLPPGLKVSTRLEDEAGAGCDSDPTDGDPVPLNGTWTGEMTILSGHFVTLAGFLTIAVTESESGEVSGKYGYNLQGSGGELQSTGTVDGQRLSPTTLQLDLNDEIGMACSVRATLRQHGPVLFGDHVDLCQGNLHGTILVDPDTD